MSRRPCSTALLPALGRHQDSLGSFVRTSRDRLEQANDRSIGVPDSIQGWTDSMLTYFPCPHVANIALRILAFSPAAAVRSIPRRGLDRSFGPRRPTCWIMLSNANRARRVVSFLAQSVTPAQQKFANKWHLARHAAYAIPPAVESHRFNLSAHALERAQLLLSRPLRRAGHSNPFHSLHERLQDSSASLRGHPLTAAAMKYWRSTIWSLTTSIWVPTA